MRVVWVQMFRPRTVGRANKAVLLAIFSRGESAGNHSQIKIRNDMWF